MNIRALCRIAAVFTTCLVHSYARAEVRAGSFEVEFEHRFRGTVTVLEATERHLFISDVGYAPDDRRPVRAARVADDGSILGYSPEVRQSVVRLLVCDRHTGEVLHEFPGPVSRRPRVSGFELPLTSPPLLLDDGFVFLTADWHLRRVRLPQDGAPVAVWELDVPVATRLTPRLSDDMGYLMPQLTRCGETLLFTFNSAPAPDTIPVEISLAAVDLAGGELRWVRSLGSTGALDRSPTCLPAGGGRFHVATPTGDIQTYSTRGVLHHAFRPADEYFPNDPEGRFSSDIWQLHRINESTITMFSGESPEFGSSVRSPIFGVQVGTSGRMRRVWQSSVVRAAVAPAAIGSNLYLRSHSGLTAFCPDTGKELWEYTNGDHAINCEWSAPAVHEGVVYFPTIEGLQVFEDAEECRHLGTVELTSPDLRAPLIHGDRIYIAAGDVIYALRLPLFE